MHLIASTSRAAKADRTNFDMNDKKYQRRKSPILRVSQYSLKTQNRVIHSFSILEVINIWLASIIEIGDLLNFHFFLDFRFYNNNEIRFYNNRFYDEKFCPMQWNDMCEIVGRSIWRRRSRRPKAAAKSNRPTMVGLFSPKSGVDRGVLHQITQ